MNNLTQVIADLETLSNAYARRIAANGIGHPDNEYLRRQAFRFYTAQHAIEDAVREAGAR